jgi:hypothetical protein
VPSSAATKETAVWPVPRSYCSRCSTYAALTLKMEQRAQVTSQAANAGTCTFIAPARWQCCLRRGASQSEARHRLTHVKDQMSCTRATRAYLCAMRAGAGCSVGAPEATTGDDWIQLDSTRVGIASGAIPASGYTRSHIHLGIACVFRSAR